MGRRSKVRAKRKPAERIGWWRSLDPVRRRAAVLGGFKWLALAAIGLTAGMGLDRLDAHVGSQILRPDVRSELTFLDLPPAVERLGGTDLVSVVSDLLDLPWTDPRLCRAIGERLVGTGWIDELWFVRRTGDGRFEVSARFREPLGRIQQGSDFMLVDADGVRLPGVYYSDPAWPSIEGVRAVAPLPGERWPGDDLAAGLRLLKVVRPEPFGGQITGVDVGNLGGRAAAGRTHVELLTDRPEGRIRWGSAPGREIEENSAEQKLAILRANFAATGRADAGHQVIDISTFSDRFTTPG